MRQIMSDSDAKINAVLTPDQQAKYAQIEQEMRDHMRQHARQ
jgi:Spy/CpxP family protein refolding chaperone